MDVRIPRSDCAYVALEVANVNGIKTNDRDEEADVGFGELPAYQEVFAFEELLNSVERVEDSVYGNLIRFRLSREARLIHSICVARLA